MREQIRRILGLVKEKRLSAEDAASLLSALDARLSHIQASTFEQLFKLLETPDFGPDRITDLLLGRLDSAAQRASGTFPGGQHQTQGNQSQSQWGGGQQSQSQSQGGAPTPPRPPQPSFKIGGAPYPFEDLGDAISARVEEALGGLLGKGQRSARSGTILRIETEDENGGTFSANLPLSLAAHAERLIPPHAQKALERGGLTIEALKMLLQAGPPPGPLLEAEDEDGNSVTLSIR